MMMKVTFSLTLLSLTTSVSGGFLDIQREQIVPMPMHSFPQDCGSESSLNVIPSAVSMLQADNVPGAGIDTIYDAKKFQPFKKVLKDGYMFVNCVKDSMYYSGDKYGDHKHDYKLGPVSRVSIVHYNGFIAKEDRVEITPTVCFEFCRTVPNMGYFGITNGNNCYCTPFFNAMESDSSQCDTSCQGDSSLMCGNKEKSSIFAMHMCGSTASDLAMRADTAGELSADMTAKVKKANAFVKEMEYIAADIMPLFSFVGDSGASNLAQKAKEMSSLTLNHHANDTQALATRLAALARDADNLAEHPDLAQSSVMIKAERVMEDIDATVIKAEEATARLNMMMSYVSPPPPFFDAKKALPNYVPVMYFIDNKFDGIDDPKTKGKPAVPTTCTGDLVGLPIVGQDAESCAQVCDQNLVNGCVAFQHFDSRSYSQEHDGQLCFLFSKFKTGFYYTGCTSPDAKQEETGCWAKYSKFAGGKFDGSGTLKPGGIPGDPWCKTCFEKFTKADRCYTDKLKQLKK